MLLKVPTRNLFAADMLSKVQELEWRRKSKIRYEKGYGKICVMVVSTYSSKTPLKEQIVSRPIHYVYSPIDYRYIFSTCIIWIIDFSLILSLLLTLRTIVTIS